MAIFGLLLYFITLWLPMQKAFEIETRIDAHKVEIATLKAEVDAYDYITKNKKEHDLNVVDFYIMGKKNTATLIGKSNQIITLHSHLRTYVFYSTCGRYVSYFLVLVGFLLWYIKVQRHHDKILKNSAE